MNTSNQRSRTNWSDDNVDTLLTSFFQHEMPAEIRSLPAGTVVDRHVAAPASVTGPRPWSSLAGRRLATAALALGVIAAVGIMFNSQSDDASGIANQETNSTQGTTTNPVNLLPLTPDEPAIPVSNGTVIDQTSDWPDESASEIVVPAENPNRQDAKKKLPTTDAGTPASDASNATVDGVE